MAIPDPATTDWVPVWNPQSAGPIGPPGPPGPAFTAPWVDVAFNAANFTGNGGMTWLVAAGNQTTFAYQKVDKSAIFTICIDGTTIGGTISNLLFIQIPFTSTKLIRGPYVYVNAGVDKRGVFQISGGDNKILLLTGYLATNFASGSFEMAIQLIVPIP